MNRQTGAKWLGVNEAKHNEYIDRRIEQSDKIELITAMYGSRVRVNNRCIKRIKKQAQPANLVHAIDSADTLFNPIKGKYLFA